MANRMVGRGLSLKAFIPRSIDLMYHTNELRMYCYVHIDLVD